MLIACAQCETYIERRSPMHKYCDRCSEERDLKRKRLWARANPASEDVRRRAKQNKKSRAIQNGIQRSADVSQTIAWDTTPPDLLWSVKISVPFSYAASKNAIYTLRNAGHVALRKESRAMRTLITTRLKAAISDTKIAHNKLWIDIFVQKPNNRGDAINVIDLVCDAIKDAVPVDDRWFSIRRLDWEVSKTNPKLFIGIGQDTNEDARVCSYCGIILPLSAFGKRKDNYLGVGRECRECTLVKRKTKKAITEIEP